MVNNQYRPSHTMTVKGWIGDHPRGNYWTVIQLEEGDEYYDPERPMWGVFLQLSGMVAPLAQGFYSAEGAEAFIRDDILGAGADIEGHKTVPGQVVNDKKALPGQP